MKKLSTSRWREATRSGEVSPEAGQRVMRSLGITPEEWARRLGQGAGQLAARHGYEVITIPTASLGTRGLIETSEDIGRQAAENPIAALKRYRQFLEAKSGGGGITHSGRKQIVLLEPKKYPLDNALSKHHEAREAQRMERLNRLLESRGVPLRTALGYNRAAFVPEAETKILARTVGGFFEGYSPKKETAFRTELAKRLIAGKALKTPYSGYTTQHVDPTLPIQDIRESRLFPKDVRQRWANKRTETGELQDIAKAIEYKGPHPERMNLPRKQIENIARRIQKQQWERAVEAASAESSPVAKMLGMATHKVTAPLRAVLHLFVHPGAPRLAL